ncbi:aminotransferase class III-fold pyridoxal phosphate-dependent enzyme [Hoeflea alexandrii]|uniref:aminotransferase class III-fold pyridoxal phosphate-dependent enzyme n=1 Tax=Hoeflea alexandrii TaxID=288436 RepID=UPI0022AEDB34|nr:aminotransferase class III-fold pyridoxal phosphate-dependent enzyme [Hoeflea alexandrii]MCZ4291520.1 aminotransferase class III-fold pyridoxal phosphate-dependent enzyme [Hoeflea alexandrii]
MKDANFLTAHNAQNVWHPMSYPGALKETPPKIIVGAEGVEIIDVNGHRLLDGVGGLWNMNLGYSNAPIKAAIAKQLDRLPYYSIFNGTTHDMAIELSVMLAEFFAPDGLSRAFFTSGGSDSVEITLRLARQYHKIRGEAGRVKFLSLKKGYHGTHTLGASVNGNTAFRTSYEPLMPGCFHIPAPNPYRNPFDESDPAQLAQLCLAALEAEIDFQSADTIAAFIMEPILGAGGVIVPHESFMPGVREICDRHGILLISDEVITAFGRTGDSTGARHWGVKPDLLSCAKAITNGYFPFGAAMISDQVAEVFEKDESGRAGLYTGYTYSGHPVGAAAALACLQETTRLNVPANAAARGTQLFDGIVALQDKHELIGHVRGGHGLMTAVELVSDRSAKTPLDAASMKVIHGTAYEAGVMLRVSGNNLIMSPPLIITPEDVEKILAAIDHALSTAAA